MAYVLVTGANGFAGAAIGRHLLACGWQVRGTVRRAEAPVPEGVEKVVSGPLDGATDWQAALDGTEAVVHCAARVHVLRETEADPLAAFRRVNVDGTRHLAEQAAATSVRRFVFLSSIGAAVAEAAPDSASPYQRSKREAEQALQTTAAGSAMTLVMLRPPLIYGPGAPGNFARLARLIDRGWPLPVASLDNRRSLLFVGNLVGAVEAALSCTISTASPLAVCDGEEALTGSLTVDNGEITRAFGWSPRYSLDAGLALTFREAA